MITIDKDGNKDLIEQRQILERDNIPGQEVEETSQGAEVYAKR